MLEEVEWQKTQVDRDLHEKWQDVLGKIDVFPQGIEEKLQLQQSIFQLQQSIFMQEISTILSELTVLRQDKEQLQLQQSVFMQEISTIISELAVLRQDKEQIEREEIASEVRQLMDEMKAHILEDTERQKKQEERESQLTKELHEKWQDVLGRVDALPQTIEEQLELQQDKEQREREETASEVRQLMDEMKGIRHMLEEGAGDSRNITEILQQKDLISEEISLLKVELIVLRKAQEEVNEHIEQQRCNFEKFDTFPQRIAEQLQQQGSMFNHEILSLKEELAVIRQLRKHKLDPIISTFQNSEHQNIDVQERLLSKKTQNTHEKNKLKRKKRYH